MSFLESLKSLVIPAEPLHSRAGATVLLLDTSEQAAGEALLKEIESGQGGVIYSAESELPTPIEPSVRIDEEIAVGDEFIARVEEVDEAKAWVRLNQETVAELSKRLAQGAPGSEAEDATKLGARLFVTVVSSPQKGRVLVAPSDHPAVMDKSPGEIERAFRKRDRRRAKVSNGARGASQRSSRYKPNRKTKQNRPADS